MKSFDNTILMELENHGYKTSIASVKHVEDLQNDILFYYKKGMIDEKIYNSYLDFKYDYSKISPEPKSLIVVAMKQPITKVNFKLNKEMYPVIIPPTYISSSKNTELNQLISSILNSRGYTVTKCILPIKLLAVRTGLGEYGRNNITYIPGMGSFHKLTGFYSDMPIYEDNWNEIKVMESCKSCKVCIQNCPTGCINEDISLIQSANCITYFNEGKSPFPEWINLEWHNSLIGCMNCQNLCPQNKDYIDNIEEGITFTHNETEMFMNNIELEKLPTETQDKLKSIEIYNYYDMFLRNLNVLLENVIIK